MDRPACVELSGAAAAGTSTLLSLLEGFSPRIEASEELGCLWLEAGGLLPLFPSLEAWASELARDLAATAPGAALVVGWERFAVYAIARHLNTGPGPDPVKVMVLGSPEREQALLAKVPLSCLPLCHRDLELLGKLGLGSLGTLERLPAATLSGKLGDGGRRLLAMASGKLEVPTRPLATPEPLQAELLLEDASGDSARLLGLLTRLCSELLKRLEGTDRAVSEIRFLLSANGHSTTAESLGLACPTTDLATMAELIRLRLETTPLPAAITELSVKLGTERVEREQLHMFQASGRRDLEAGNRALDRIRAEFGEGSVLLARLEDRHLPQASFSWQPCARLKPPRPQPAAAPCLIRRLFSGPRTLSGLSDLRLVAGPYLISGAWWRTAQSQEELRREYHFAECSSGNLLWIYRQRDLWFLQGIVE